MTMDGYLTRVPVPGPEGYTWQPLSTSNRWVREHSDGRITVISEMASVPGLYQFSTYGPDRKEAEGSRIATAADAAKFALTLWESNLATRNPLGFATT